MSVAKNVAGAVKRAGPTFTGGVHGKWTCGKPYQLPAIKENIGAIEKKLRVFGYTQLDYCKVGLLLHDTTSEEFSGAAKARKRMTHDDLQDHYYRWNRALLMSLQKQNLPSEEWTPMDAPHLYMKDIMDQITKEDFEKNVMKCALNDYNDNWDRILMIPFRIRHYMRIKAERSLLSDKLGMSVV